MVRGGACDQHGLGNGALHFGTEMWFGWRHFYRGVGWAVVHFVTCGHPLFVVLVSHGKIPWFHHFGCSALRGVERRGR